jgi:glycosyltransferase involved in cell wall biosynthesis
VPWPETVLLVHNRYRTPGGEEAVYEAEAALLESRGHRVLRYERHNDEITGASSVSTAARAVWNRSVYLDLVALGARERLDVVHVHNTFAVMSPAVHHAARRAGAVVVQTLHNYRLLCPAGTFLRDGVPCEACLGSALPLRAVVHGCYRDDRASSAAVAGVLVAHRAIGTWRHQVHAYIALSEFARSRFAAGGLPAERLHVKGGFLEPDPGAGAHEGQYLLFVGRLSEEKGVRTLLDAWLRLRAPVRLKLIGDGPLAGQVRTAAAADHRIEWLGARPRADVLAEMRGARALVLPSVCYENFPMVVPEASASGLPIIAARIGSLAEIVSDGETGFHFRAGDPDDLAARVSAVHDLQADALRQIGDNARAAFENQLTADHAYRRLLDIYHAASAVRVAARRSARSK